MTKVQLQSQRCTYSRKLAQESPSESLASFQDFCHRWAQSNRRLAFGSWSSPWTRVSANSPANSCLQLCCLEELRWDCARSSRKITTFWRFPPQQLSAPAFYEFVPFLYLPWKRCLNCQSNQSHLVFAFSEHNLLLCFHRWSCGGPWQLQTLFELHHRDLLSPRISALLHWSGYDQACLVNF